MTLGGGPTILGARVEIKILKGRGVLRVNMITYLELSGVVQIARGAPAR